MNSLDAESLSMLNVGHEQIMEPQKREGHTVKKKGGVRPVDYSAVDVWLDLKAELKRHNIRIERVYTLYFYLKRLVNA